MLSIRYKPYMLSIRYKPYMLSVALLNVVMLSVVAPGQMVLDRMTWAQCDKTFYCGNLPPFHGYTIILCYKTLVLQ
jgi:hypothetical protein